MNDQTTLASDGPTARSSEDACLLREFTHRTGNEIGAALASLHLLRSDRRLAGRLDLLDQSIARLEHFGAVHRLLAGSFRGLIDLSKILDALCRGIIGARPGAAESMVTMMLPTMTIDGAVARRAALIAAELVNNALRHALEGRRGNLTLSARRDDDDLILEVVDDGPGVRAGAETTGSGLGRGIVAELVERGGGTITVDTGCRGTTVRVVMPLQRGYGGDDGYPF